MDDLRSWESVGVTDHPKGGLFPADVGRTNFYLVSAVLRRAPRGGMGVTLFWQTGDERFSVKPDGDMKYQNGDKVTVLVSTVTDTHRGCANGCARVEAIQTSPRTWCRNVI